RVLLFACAIAGLTALAFGVVPALFMSRGSSDLDTALRASGRGGDAGAARRKARSVLVVAEVALAVMLLVAAALLARGFQRLLRQDPGFQPGSAITASVELPYSYRDYRKIADFYSSLLASIRSQPGVTTAGAASGLPLAPGWRFPYEVGGRPVPQDLPQM